MRIEIRHGWLSGCHGIARCSDGLWFAGVRGDLDDPETEPSHWLNTYVQEPTDSEEIDNEENDPWSWKLSPLLHNDKIVCFSIEYLPSDKLWVRAALPQVFRFVPLHVSEERDDLLNVAFVAVVPIEPQFSAGYLFACTDSFATTGLVFSRQGPNETLRSRIAQAFWKLLLDQSADQLTSFSADRIHDEEVAAFSADRIQNGISIEYVEEFVVGFSGGEFYVEAAVDPHEDVTWRPDQNCRGASKPLPFSRGNWLESHAIDRDRPCRRLRSRRFDS